MSKRTASSRRNLSSVTSLSSDLISSYIVIGNGPIGASVAKHLVASLAKKTSGRTEEVNVVTIVDGRPRGMGSSHSDRARLIRTFDAEGDVNWTRWNWQSLEAFPEIEKLWNEDKANSNSNSNFVNSKKRKRKFFFTQCGALLLGDEEFVARSKKAAEKSLSPSIASLPSFSLLSPTECQRKWPYLEPKIGCDVALFDPSGGIIDPLAFIEAQNHNTIVGSGRDIQLDILSDVATNIRNGGTTVELASGKVLRATKKIVLCGGAYSGPLLEKSGIKNNPSSLFPSLRISKRTVALLEVSEESVNGILRDMPTIKYAFGLEQSETTETSSGGEHSRIEAGSVYILPPVCYPERGEKWFVKIGGGPNDLIEDENDGSKTKRELIDNWLSSEGDSSSAEWLGGICRSLLPGVPFEGLQSMACVTTTAVDCNSSGVVMDDVLGDGSLIAISACQGKGAGPSDQVGAHIVRNIL